MVAGTPDAPAATSGATAIPVLGVAGSHYALEQGQRSNAILPGLAIWWSCISGNGSEKSTSVSSAFYDLAINEYHPFRTLYTEWSICKLDFQQLN